MLHLLALWFAERITISFFPVKCWGDIERHASGGDFGDIHILLFDCGSDRYYVAGGFHEPDQQGQRPDPHGGHYPVGRVLLAAVVVCMDAPVAPLDHSDMERGISPDYVAEINDSSRSEEVGCRGGEGREELVREHLAKGLSLIWRDLVGDEKVQ